MGIKFRSIIKSFTDLHFATFETQILKNKLKCTMDPIDECQITKNENYLINKFINNKFCK